MAEYPFKRIKLSYPKTECIEGDTYRFAGKIAANCVDVADKVIIEAIIAMCKDEGVTELYLLDKKFVLNAIEKALADNQNTEPAADVAEVKHGEWEIKSEIHQTLDDVDEEIYVECPYCKRTFYVPFEFEDEKILAYARENYPYCHCGAKMDGTPKESKNGRHTKRKRCGGCFP